MDRSVYTYALIKSLYDQGNDYLDSFWPFTVKVIPPGSFIDSSSMQASLKEQFDLDIPQHVLAAILQRAQKMNYVHMKWDESTHVKTYGLTDTGVRYSERLETEKEVERRINALLGNVKNFFEQRDVSLSFEKIGELLIYFIHKNIDLLIEHINPSAGYIGPATLKLEGHDQLLVEYIENAEYNEPQFYSVLQDMIMGSVISVVIYVEEPSEITEIETRKFRHCCVYMDTNFVFSVLDLHLEQFNDPAKELLDLLRKREFELKVFSFTVDEICKVINGYPLEAPRYPSTIGVDTLYSSLKRKGWTQTDAKEFITNIEQILDEQGIAVDWVRETDLNTFAASQELRDTITKYKPDQNLYHQNHDLATIAKIKELRGSEKRKIEESRAFFLTSDVRLSKFNFEKMGHRENGTVSEVILDRLLTNILWLKNPNIKPSLKSIIAAYSRDLFVKRRVWDRFYQVLQQLRKEEKVQDKNIEMLFYHRYVESVLRQFDETDTDRITPEFVLDEIEKASAHREERAKEELKSLEKAKSIEAEKKLREMEQEFLQRLKKEISKKDEQKEREWLEKIQEIKGSLRASAEKEVIKDSNIYASVLTIAVLGGISMAYLTMPFELMSLIVSIVLGGGGLFGIWKEFRTKLRSWLVDRIYKQKLAEARL